MDDQYILMLLNREGKIVQTHCKAGGVSSVSRHHFGVHHQPVHWLYPDHERGLALLGHSLLVGDPVKDPTLYKKGACPAVYIEGSQHVLVAAWCGPILSWSAIHSQYVDVGRYKIIIEARWPE